MVGEHDARDIASRIEQRSVVLRVSDPGSISPLQSGGFTASSFPSGLTTRWWREHGQCRRDDYEWLESDDMIEG